MTCSFVLHTNIFFLKINAFQFIFLNYFCYLGIFLSTFFKQKYRFFYLFIQDLFIFGFFMCIFEDSFAICIHSYNSYVWNGIGNYKDWFFELLMCVVQVWFDSFLVPLFFWMLILMAPSCCLRLWFWSRQVYKKLVTPTKILEFDPIFQNIPLLIYLNQNNLMSLKGHFWFDLIFPKFKHIRKQTTRQKEYLSQKAKIEHSKIIWCAAINYFLAKKAKLCTIFVHFTKLFNTKNCKKIQNRNK